MTDRQIQEVYYRPRDKEGTPLPIAAEHDRAELTREQEIERDRIKYYAFGTTVGIPLAELDRGWAKHLEKQRGG